MHAITIPMSAFRELLVSDRFTEMLADTIIQTDGDRNVEIYIDDDRAEALLSFLGGAVLRITKLPSDNGEAHCA